MIERIEDAALLNDWQGRDIFSVRILSLLRSYGTQYRFCSFFRQVIDGKCTAILSQLDRNFTLSLTDGFDHEELVHFFCINGYASILCDDRFFISPRFEEGAVMISAAKKELPLDGVQLDEYPKLMDLYNFVDYDDQDFKAWYVDISHRIRHKTAKAYTLSVEGVIISSGVLSSVIENYAILTAVRTEEAYRGQGYGTLLVSSICCDVKGYVYIMRDSERNESFYAGMGFKDCGKWRMYR